MRFSARAIPGQIGEVRYRGGVAFTERWTWVDDESAAGGFPRSRPAPDLGLILADTDLRWRDQLIRVGELEVRLSPEDAAIVQVARDAAEVEDWGAVVSVLLEQPLLCNVVPPAWVDRRLETSRDPKA